MVWNQGIFWGVVHPCWTLGSLVGSGPCRPETTSDTDTTPKAALKQHTWVLPGTLEETGNVTRFPVFSVASSSIQKVGRVWMDQESLMTSNLDSVSSGFLHGSWLAHGPAGVEFCPSLSKVEKGNVIIYTLVISGVLGLLGPSFFEDRCRLQDHPSNPRTMQICKLQVWRKLWED